jgi:murein DD-endopeptidase MepM/ murein hydrolase activator NlpD
MAISSPILNVKTGSTKTKATSATASTLKNIQQTLIKQGKVRKEILDRKKQFSNQRREKEQRQRLEDELEASNIVVKPSGPIQMIQSSTKGFLERILGFLAYLTAGWLMNNLPTWIAMGKEFIGRVQRMGQLVNGFMTNITNIFTGFGSLLSATFQNLIQFDLFDSSNRVKDAFGELTGSVDDMGRELEEAIRLITTPLTEGMVTGEDAPATGTQQTSEGAYEPGAPLQGDGGTGGKLLPIHKQALDIISRPESGGSYNAMNQGNINDKIVGSTLDSKTKIKKNLTDMTIGEVLQRQKWLMNKSNPQISDYGVYAAGRYQFIPIQLPVSMKSAGLSPGDKFSPENQDLMAAALMQDRGIQPWTVGGSKYSKQELEIVEKARRTPFGSASSSTTSPQTIQGTGQYFRPLPQGSFKDGKSQRYLAPREGTRKHLGIDITESNWKRGTDPRIPVVAIRGGVVSSRDYKSGTEYDSGMVIDQDDGYSIRYLHMSPSVRPGQKVSAGQRIGRLVDLGDQTHLHIELYSGSKRLDPTDYIKTIEKGGVPRAIARQQPTPAQIAPSQTQQQRQQVSQQLAQDRTGPTVIFQQPPEPEPQGPSYSAGAPSMMPLQVDEFTLVNNFMKKKLLLDLAYL